MAKSNTEVARPAKGSRKARAAERRLQKEKEKADKQARSKKRADEGT